MYKKMMIRMTRMRCFLAAVVMIAALMPLKTFGIGQTTDPIVIKNALRGNEYQQNMIIINTEKTDSTIALAGQGDAGKWAEFYKLNDFSAQLSELSMKSGEVRSVSVVFKIPQDTPNGEYKGFISAIKKPDASSANEGSSTTVSQKIDREVTIDVNDNEVVSFEVSVIPKTYDLAKGEMLEIRLVYDNRGNTSITPQAQIKIKKDDQTVYNSIYPYPEDKPGVKPGAVYEIPAIQIPTNNFEKGKFRAEMSFLVDGKTVFEKKFGFSVDMFSSGDQAGVVLGAKDKNIIKGITDIGLPLYAILALFVIAGISLIYRKSRQMKKVQVVQKNIPDAADTQQ